MISVFQKISFNVNPKFVYCVLEKSSSYLHLYIDIYVCVYIYIYIYLHIYEELFPKARSLKLAPTLET